jgi:hypothetical protein
MRRLLSKEHLTCRVRRDRGPANCQPRAHAPLGALSHSRFAISSRRLKFIQLVFGTAPLDLDLAPDFDEIRHRQIKQVGRPDRIAE